MMKTDEYGNTILAQVNGWRLIPGEFCYVAHKPGKPQQVYRGGFAGALTWFDRIAGQGGMEK